MCLWNFKFNLWLGNVKLEYQKLLDSIKKTRTQTQKEISELIENVNQKMYAYEDVQSQNQDLLITISELKEKLKTAKKVQKKWFVPKTEEKQVLTKPVTSQTSPNKKKDAFGNTNTKDHVAYVNVENALKANVNVICVSYVKCVLTTCHAKCVAKYKLSTKSKVRRALFTSPMAAKFKFLDTTPVVAKA
ncbi:hypothetical protein Tco_1012142, partial [Tanacetum coccineum]